MAQVGKTSKAKAEGERCGAKGCAITHYAKGYCKKHYTQVKAHGRLTPERERGAPRVCRVPKCGRTDTVDWHCRRHARQLRIYGKIRPDRQHVMGQVGCKVSGCTSEHRAKGYCARHYSQKRWRTMQDGTVVRRARAGRKKQKATAD